MFLPPLLGSISKSSPEQTRADMFEKRVWAYLPSHLEVPQICAWRHPKRDKKADASPLNQ